VNPNLQNAGRLVLSLGLLLALIPLSGARAQNQAKKSKCAAIPVRKFKPELPKDLKGFKSGPTIRYSIEMDGSVSNVSLLKSSGSKAVDDALLDAVIKTSYRPLTPGCGPVETTVTLNIDFYR